MFPPWVVASGSREFESGNVVVTSYAVGATGNVHPTKSSRIGEGADKIKGDPESLAAP
jgi:hypothetical protein